MGHIRRLLALGEIEPRTLTSNMIWTDLCENVHLHYRNLRFDFSEKEFAAWRAANHNLGMAVEHSADKYKFREGDPNFLVQQMFDHPLESNSDYYPNRMSIELQKDNTVHVHYRDLRLHLTLSEFNNIADLFYEATAELKNLKEFPYKDVTERTLQVVDIDLIQPYDEGHRPGVMDKEHREGIEYCKKLIEGNLKIRPILIDNTGQRLDGFKRYMAHRELFLSKIECIIDPNGIMGGQHNQSMTADEYMCSSCGEPTDPKTVGGTVTRWFCDKCGAWTDLTEK